VRDEIIVDADTQANVPIRLAYVNLHSPSADWVVNCKELRPGLMIGRTLLPQDDEFAAVRVINISGSPQSIRRGLCLGEAEAVMDAIPLPIDLGSEPDCIQRSRNLAANFVGQTGGPEVTELPLGEQIEVTVGSTTTDPPVDYSHELVCERCANGDLIPEMEVIASSQLFKHVFPIIKELPSELKEMQKLSAIHFILDNADVFSKSEFDLGLCN